MLSTDLTAEHTENPTESLDITDSNTENQPLSDRAKVKLMSRLAALAPANLSTGDQKTSHRSGVAPSERDAQIHFEKMMKHIAANGGTFLLDDRGNPSVLLAGKRIPINFDPDNTALSSFVLDCCGIGTLSAAAKAAIQRLQVAAAQSTSRFTLRKFSCMSQDGERLYIPTSHVRLIRVTGESILESDNGNNKDRLWLEHPQLNPFTLKKPSNGLEAFERLIVNTQACRAPAMQWLVAMHEGILPFIRDLISARFILVHIGSTGHGKTTGAKRYVLLHGLGDVAGDVTAAYLGNLGDIGFLVLDNKEQRNFTDELIDYVLFLATGATRGRAFPDGSTRENTSRPVAVITCIEGLSFKPELNRRCIEIEYARPPGQASLREEMIQREIMENRDQIVSDLIPVLQRYLQMKDTQWEIPAKLSDFPEHFFALCNLLKAYSDVAGKPKDWAEQIIDQWCRHLTDSSETDEADSELECLIERSFKESPETFRTSQTTVKGEPGTLRVTSSGELLTALTKLAPRDMNLPRDSQGLGRRLRSTRFSRFAFLETDTIPELKRTGSKRPIGFFTPD